MVNEHAYAPTLTDTARGNIRAVVGALIETAGLKETLISRVAAKDSAFLKRLHETSMNIRSYDAFMGRLSAVWPEDLEWPDLVPRPAPADVSAEDATQFANAVQNGRALKVAAEAKRIAAKAAEEARAAKRRAQEMRAKAGASQRKTHETAGGEQAPAHP